MDSVQEIEVALGAIDDELEQARFWESKLGWLIGLVARYQSQLYGDRIKYQRQLSILKGELK